MTESDLKAYVSEMHSADFASSTISRNIASIRALFHYLFKKGVVSEDPSENLRAPRIEKKMPEILTVQEVDRLLSQPNPHTCLLYTSSYYVHSSVWTSGRNCRSGSLVSSVPLILSLLFLADVADIPAVSGNLEEPWADCRRGILPVSYTHLNYRRLAVQQDNKTEFPEIF